jgi:hypothetical protein
MLWAGSGAATTGNGKKSMMETIKDNKQAAMFNIIDTPMIEVSYE